MAASMASTLLESVAAAGPAIVSALPFIQAQVHQSQSINQGHLLHALAIQQAQRQHHEAISLDIESSRKEAARDQWGQKTAGAQTLMIVTTLMFSCAFGLIIEGNPPTEPAASEVVVQLYSATVASTVWLLFISLWLAMKLQARLSKYVIPDPTMVYDCGRTHPTFEQFYLCHCKHITQASYRLFYLGTASLVASAMILMWERFNVLFLSQPAATIFVAIGCSGFVVMVVLQCLMPTSPRLDLASDASYFEEETGKPGVVLRVPGVTVVPAEPVIALDVAMGAMGRGDLGP